MILTNTVYSYFKVGDSFSYQSETIGKTMVSVST
jgi:hypothetical protein